MPGVSFLELLLCGLDVALVCLAQLQAGLRKLLAKLEEL